MKINKCSFQIRCLDPLLIDSINTKAELNLVILKIRIAMESVKKNPLTEEEREEIKSKIDQITEREFGKDLEERVEFITKALKQFIDVDSERSVRFDQNKTQKKRSPFFVQNKKQERHLTSAQLSSPPPITQEIGLEENQLIFGIENKTGNDCYQNSLCQFLQCPTLKTQFIDRLPDNLWREFNRTPIHSKALRDLIRKETDFPDDMFYEQKDAAELLFFLSNKLNEEDPAIELIPAAREEPGKKKNCDRIIKKTFAQQIKRHLVSFLFFPLVLWKKAIDFLDYCVNKMAELQEQETEIELIPINAMVRPLRKLRSDPNPLISTMLEYRKWNVSDVPDEFKTNDYFGGETNQSLLVLENKLNYLTLAIEGDNFTRILENYFEESEKRNEPSVLSENPEIKANYSLSRYFQEEPSSLILSLKRFTFENGRSKKNECMIQGIPPRLKLPSKALNGKPAEKELELQSFIVHQGRSSNSGHYICYRKVEGEWHLFNDKAEPEKLTEEQALDASKKAYLIFYDQIES